MKWGYGDPLAYDCPPRTESALIGELTGIVPALEKKKPAEEIPTLVAMNDEWERSMGW